MFSSDATSSAGQTVDSDSYLNWEEKHKAVLTIVAAWEKLENLGFTVTRTPKTPDGSQIVRVKMYVIGKIW